MKYLRHFHLSQCCERVCGIRWDGYVQDGYTAFHLASRKNHLFSTILLEKGSNIEAVTNVTLGSFFSVSNQS